MSVVLHCMSLWETPDRQLVLSHSTSVLCFHPAVKQLMERDCDLEGCSALDLLGRGFLEGGWRWCGC